MVPHSPIDRHRCCPECPSSLLATSPPPFLAATTRPARCPQLRLRPSAIHSSKPTPPRHPSSVPSASPDRLVSHIPAPAHLAIEWLASLDNEPIILFIYIFILAADSELFEFTSHPPFSLHPARITRFGHPHHRRPAPLRSAFICSRLGYLVSGRRHVAVLGTVAIPTDIIPPHRQPQRFRRGLFASDASPVSALAVSVSGLPGPRLAHRCPRLGPSDSLWTPAVTSPAPLAAQTDLYRACTCALFSIRCHRPLAAQRDSPGLHFNVVQADHDHPHPSLTHVDPSTSGSEVKHHRSWTSGYFDGSTITLKDINTSPPRWFVTPGRIAS